MRLRQDSVTSLDVSTDGAASSAAERDRQKGDGAPWAHSLINACSAFPEALAAVIVLSLLWILGR